jgi:hypothetical protein
VIKEVRKVVAIILIVIGAIIVVGGLGRADALNEDIRSTKSFCVCDIDCHPDIGGCPQRSRKAKNTELQN